MDKYRLFIGRYKELPEKEFTYYTPTSGYMLVYTNKDIQEQGFKKVLPEKECNLLQEEKTWLQMTKLTLLAKAISVSAEQVTESINRFAECLKKELEEEKQKDQKD